MWGARDPYEIDFEEVYKAAKDYNVALEINCYPDRLDLNDIHALGAKNAGVKLALGTDAHRLEQLSFMELGISVARRAWLEERDLINCMDIKKISSWLRR